MAFKTLTITSKNGLMTHTEYVSGNYADIVKYADGLERSYGAAVLFDDLSELEFNAACNSKTETKVVL